MALVVQPIRRDDAGRSCSGVQEVGVASGWRARMPPRRRRTTFASRATAGHRAGSSPRRRVASAIAASAGGRLASGSAPACAGGRDRAGGTPSAGADQSAARDGAALRRLCGHARSAEIRRLGVRDAMAPRPAGSSVVSSHKHLPAHRRGLTQTGVSEAATCSGRALSSPDRQAGRRPPPCPQRPSDAGRRT